MTVPNEAPTSSDRNSTPLTPSSNFSDGVVHRSRASLADSLRPGKPGAFHLLALSAVVFIIGGSVRLLQWQDRWQEPKGPNAPLADITRSYKRAAQTILEEGRLLYPLQYDAGDARPILHPPGYAVLLASLSRFDDPDSAVVLVQIAADAVAGVLVVLIASELFPLLVALLAGLLVAFSPHLSYYSLSLSPDSLPVLPVLAAIYLLILAKKRDGGRLAFAMVMSSGVLIGVSCWLRANG